MKKITIRGGMMAVGILLAGFANAEIHISESNTKQNAEDVTKARIAKAEAGVCAVEMACIICWIDQMKPPTNLVQLVVGEHPFLDGGEGALYDPWNNKYEMEVRDHKIVIKSAGADGVMGTSDDILSSDVRNRNDENKKSKKLDLQPKMQAHPKTNSVDVATRK